MPRSASRPWPNVIATRAPVITTIAPTFDQHHDTTIENLPINGRRWSTFALSTLRRKCPMGGVRSGEASAASPFCSSINTVDGADNNQAFFSEERGAPASLLTSEAGIQEFQINTSTIAEYGRSAGGVVKRRSQERRHQLHVPSLLGSRTSDLEPSTLSRSKGRQQRDNHARSLSPARQTPSVRRRHRRTRRKGQASFSSLAATANAQFPGNRQFRHPGAHLRADNVAPPGCSLCLYRQDANRKSIRGEYSRLPRLRRPR